jgi:Protein of unknown function (DUF3179)
MARLSLALALILCARVALASEALIVQWKTQWPATDFSRHTVQLEEIESGGPPKDGIPAIDRPRFNSARMASQWLDPREPVIAVEIAGAPARAYPLSILIWHEIVNDRAGGVPIAVTFCPLCNASIVFDRRVMDEVLDFGTTGKLRHSDLVMYDRQTQSWWQQFTGTGIVGRFAGARLRQIASQIVAFQDFRDAHPEGRVLSRATGFDRPYGRNPYGGYDRIDQSPFLLGREPDPRLPPMERVIAVSTGGTQRIYPFSALAHSPVINDVVGGEPVVILSRGGTLSVLDADVIRASRRVPSANAFSRRLGGQTLDFVARGGKIYDRQSQSEWDLLGRAVAGPLAGRKLPPTQGGVHFAFAWLAFNPHTEIYGQ